MAYKVKDIAKVARMYYQDNMKQDSISRRLGISRYTVSRMLRKAINAGMVRIEIIEPEEFSKAS